MALGGGARGSLIIVLNILSLSLLGSYRGVVHQIGPFVVYIAMTLSFFYLNRKAFKKAEKLCHKGCNIKLMAVRKPDKNQWVELKVHSRRLHQTTAQQGVCKAQNESPAQFKLREKRTLRTLYWDQCFRGISNSKWLSHGYCVQRLKTAETYTPEG